MKVFNLFPLTVLQNKIHIEEDERNNLVNEIIKMKKQVPKISNLLTRGPEIPKVMNFYFLTGLL